MAQNDDRYKFQLEPPPGPYTFDPIGYFGALGNALGGLWGPSTPQEPPPLQLVETAAPPSYAPANASPAPSSGGFSLPGGLTGSDLAAIVGGLGLGLARPNVGTAALQNFSAINLMQNRQDQRREAQERIDLYRQIEQRREDAQLAADGVIRPGMDPFYQQLAEHNQQRQQMVMNEMFGTPQPATAMQAGAPPPAPTQQPPGATYQPVGSPSATTPFTPLPETPPVRNIDPSQGPPRLEATQATDDFVFPNAPQAPPSSVNKSFTYKGMTVSKNQPTINPKEFATQRAVAELSELVATQDDAVATDPRRAFRTIMKRYPDADAADVKRDLTNTMINAHVDHALATDPNLDPKSAYVIGFNAARKDLGLLFSPPDSARTMSTQVPSIDERRSAAIGTPGERETQARLNAIEAGREGAIAGAKNMADFYTKILPPEQLQQFEAPPAFGQTGAQIAGKAPMSKEREVGVTTRERERSQAQTALEPVAPLIGNIISKAEEVRQQFENMSAQGLIQQGVNWFDYAQSQITGMPGSDFGKAVKTYDDMVKTNGVMLARAYQAQKGNLTEQERKIGDQGFPQTLRELYNNPQAANDRLSVMGDVISMELRDPTYRLPRLNPTSPMSPFEQHVESVRQQRIAARPDLYTAGPQSGAPPNLQAPLAPPVAPPSTLTPEQQRKKAEIEAEINSYIRKKK